MAAPLWAQALKGVADLGTVVGNGLAFGRGEDLKQTLGWGVQNTAKALGLMSGDYTPLKDYLAQGANELSAARQGAGPIGSIAETAAGIAGAGAGGAALLRGGKAAFTAAKAMPSVLPAVKAWALPLLGGATAYGMVGSGTTPQDFNPPAAPGKSSATTGAQPGSKQAGPAALDQSNEANWSADKKRFVDLMSSVPLGTLRQAMEVGQIGATKAPSPRDMAFQRLTSMLNQQYESDLNRDAQGTPQGDVSKAQAQYIQNLTSLLQPSGVPFMNVDGGQ